jgi:hypothetical protein
MFPPIGQKTVIGMLHLLPLPGSPRSTLSLPDITEHALRDADALSTGGIHALLLENFGDTPFHPARVPPHTVASMTAIATEVHKRFPLPLGINVLRNDGQSALAIALATGAAFIRVNVLCGARVADQGLIHGIAHDLLRDRAMLRAEHVKILADVDVKHSAPLAPRDLKDEIEDTLRRALADALILSGTGTGKSTDLEKVKRAKSLAPQTPLLVGSGITPETIEHYLAHADAFIVGTSLKSEGIPTNPVDPARVRDLMRRLS